MYVGDPSLPADRQPSNARACVFKAVALALENSHLLLHDKPQFQDIGVVSRPTHPAESSRYSLGMGYPKAGTDRVELYSSRGLEPTTLSFLLS